MTVGHVVGGESGRSPVVAAVLSAVVPGAGQWYAGRRLRSLIYFVPILLVLIGVGAWLGTLFSVYLTFLEPFVIGATCMWCITSALVMMALLWVSARPAVEAWHRLRGQPLNRATAGA